jgi:aspartate-semialdehyde dehydrogenase
MKKKIAILGARGYVGSNLAKFLTNTFDIVQFSHNSVFVYDGDLNYEESFMPSSIVGKVEEFDCILFLLESKNNFDREAICELFISIANESKKAKIIFF